MKKASLTFTAILTVIALSACGQARSTSNQSKSVSTSTSAPKTNGKLDESQVVAPQVGLSDQEWNRSLGTVSDGQDTNRDNAPTRILTPEAKNIIIYFSRSGSTDMR